MALTRRNFLKGIGLIAGGIAGGTLFEMLRRYTPPNDGTPTEKHLEDNVTITTEVSTTLTPTLENKLFEFVFPDSTPEQYKTFHDNALEDYRKVLGVYGINEKDARLKINIYLETYPNGYSAQRYSLGFFFGGKSGSAGGISIDDFTTDRRGLRHEIPHAINHTLFPTKNNIEPWYNTFDEGSAMYASGEINREKGNEWVDLAGLNKDGTINTMASGGIPADEAYALLEKNPELFWKRRAYGHYVPGHVMGTDFFNLAIRNGLTPEKFRDVLVPELEKASKNGGLSKEGIQKSFESAGVKINYALIEKGIEIVYKK